MLNLNFTPFPTLATERLLLKQLGIEDANEIMVLRSDARVNEFIDRPGPITIDEAKKFIEEIDKRVKSNESIYWAIALKNKPSYLIGTICYWNISVQNDMGEIGYELKPEYHGKGLMQEAVSKVISYGFNHLKLKLITALPNASNNKSIQLLLKNNFQLDVNYKFVSNEDAGGLLVYYLTCNG
jgi:ribosomal-protein-alanine N-acetyltransferase